MLHLLPSPANRLDEIGLGERLGTREITSGDLGIDFDTRVGWDEVVFTIGVSKNQVRGGKTRHTGNIVTFVNGNSAVHDSVVFPEKSLVSTSSCDVEEN
jgi:hypothetical protein